MFVFAGVLLFNNNLSVAQSEQAVFHLQVYQSDSSLQSSGTGFFLDGNHGYSYASLFQKGAFAKAVLNDGSEHRITKINGFDPGTGVVRFELDNMLSANFSKLKKKNTMSANGSGVKILHATNDKSIKTISKIITKKEVLIGYGEAVLVEGNLGKDLFGCPVINTLGEVEGIVVSGGRC